MTKTTSTTKKSKAVAEVQQQTPTEQQTSALPAPTLDPEQARKDLAAIFAQASKAAAAPKAATKAARQGSTSQDQLNLCSFRREQSQSV